MVNPKRSMELVERFKTIPTGNISDAMDELGIQRGVLIGGPAPLSIAQSKMVGYAYTIQHMPRHQAAKGEKLAKQSEVINKLAQPGDVVVIDVGGRKDVCTLGVMLAMRAKVRGLAGFVINGCCRDINELLEQKLPIFCTGVTPVRSSPFLETVGLNVPVVIGGVQIRPNDLIVTDDTGIIVVPVDRAEEILRVAIRIKAVEERMMQYIQEGLDYAECRKRAEAEIS